MVRSSGGGTRNVTVNVGVASSADFVGGGSTSATTLDAVTVVGSGFVNPIDVTSVESTTILTSEQIARIPVPRDTTSVALLAPGTVRGDAAFGNLASFGGASVAENQYFVNGFNITNSFRSLNFSQVPFEAIQEHKSRPAAMVRNLVVPLEALSTRSQSEAQTSSMLAQISSIRPRA